MRRWGIVFIVLALMVITVLSSGCTAENAKEQPCLTCTPPTPFPAIDKLYESGFTAFINHDYPTALDFYNKSIAADPKYIRAWIGRGDTLMRMNRTSEAISAYDSALAINNEIPEFWNKRGEALMAIGNYTEARDSFDKALKFAPEYAAAKENRDLAIAKLK